MTCTAASHSADPCPCGVPDFPVVICNPPNQPAILYRVGDYLAFRDKLLRPLPGETQLTLWQPGAEGDLAVQMVEWWAYLADILTFYSERIANEAYLGTAILPESFNHLVQLLGYRPRPALGSKVTLAGKLTPGARTPVSLPRGLQVQSKPGPGAPPQTFELDKASALLAPDIISVDVIPDHAYLLARPADTSGGSNTLWLAGAVHTVKPGDNLLLINCDAFAQPPVQADYGWINVLSVQPATDPLGNAVTVIGFAFIASTLASGALADNYVLLRASQSSPLWGFPTATAIITDTSVNLAGLARTLTPGALFLLDTGAGSSPPPTALLVAGYAESFWYANCGATAQATSAPASPPPAIGIPISTITFASLTGASSLAPSSVTVRYAFRPAGNLTPVLDASSLTYPAGGSVFAPAAAGATFPDAQPPVLLEDGTGAATAATLIPSSATDAAITIAPTLPAVSLTSPIDVMFNLLAFSRGKTVPTEVLGSGNPTVAGQDFALKNSPVTYFADPASVSGDGFSSTVQVSIDNRLWREVQSFYGQPADAQVFVLREDDAGQTHVTFGDGLNGALLPTGVNNVVANYRYGAGAGAPPTDKLTVIQTPQPGLSAIRNPLAPIGGADADSPARLRTLAPRSVLTFNRAVSLDDYAALAMTASGVTQAVAGYAFDPISQRPKVTVWVAGDDGAVAAATQTLSGVAMPGQGLSVLQALPVKVALSLTFVCDSALDAPAIQAALTTALTDPGVGLFGVNVIGIGQVIYDSQIEAACLKIAGVRAIHDLRLESLWVLESGAKFQSYRRTRRPTFKVIEGCGDRRHDPGAGAYFQVTSLWLDPSTSGAP